MNDEQVSVFRPGSAAICLMREISHALGQTVPPHLRADIGRVQPMAARWGVDLVGHLASGLVGYAALQRLFHVAPTADRPPCSVCPRLCMGIRQDTPSLSPSFQEGIRPLCTRLARVGKEVAHHLLYGQSVDFCLCLLVAVGSEHLAELLALCLSPIVPAVTLKPSFQLRFHISHHILVFLVRLGEL